MLRISHNNFGFPFSRAIFDDDRVLYHGTSSTWADAIDEEGLTLRGFETLREHAKLLLSTANRESITLEFRYDLEHWGLRPGEPRKPISMTFDFWTALRYARKRGGELADAILRSSDELLANACVRGTSRREVEAVASSVRDATRGCHPVVYAIDTEPEWFGDSWPEREERRWTLEISCAVDVPANRLLARADYPPDLRSVPVVPITMAPMTYEWAVEFGSSAHPRR